MGGMAGMMPNPAAAVAMNQGVMFPGMMGTTGADMNVNAAFNPYMMPFMTP